MNSTIKNPIALEKRGKKNPKNKTSEADPQVVREFITSIPKYESHYGRSHSSRQYLHHALNKRKLYQMYKDDRQLKNLSFVSIHIFRQIFNSDFNLSFKRRHTDTCRTCHEFNTSSSSTLIPDQQKAQIRVKLLHHKTLAQRINAGFRLDVKNAMESDGEIAVITFDLEKTLETPSLTVSEAFYKRQLWTYNFCVYDEVNKQGYMYVWNESVASRGGQEIGSCLIHHFKNNLPSKTKRVIAYSDSCGGQNRNIKLTVLLKKYLNDLLPDNMPLQKIEQKYFLPGHSYNSCDRCFRGLIHSR